jgi:hypothetical protein
MPPTRMEWSDSQDSIAIRIGGVQPAADNFSLT